MGNIILRLPEELHQVARVAAAARALSLNAWLIEAVAAAVQAQAKRAGGAPVAAALKVAPRRRRPAK